MLLLITFSFAAIYFIFCVSANEYTFLGRIKLKIKEYGELILNYFPSPIRNIILFIYDYLVYKPNPVVQIFYLSLFLLLFLIYYYYGIKKFFPHKFISYNLIYVLYTIIFLSLYSFYLCSISDPGIIKKKNISSLKQKYPYDFLFNSDKPECKKCHFPKINRSKHCRVCDKCIEKFDHHCIWINNCVGAKNFRYFFYFLLIHWILVTYAGILVIIIFYYEIKEKNLLKQLFYDVQTKEQYKATYITVFRYLLFKNYFLSATAIMLLVTSFFLIFFMYFQFKLIIKNLTSAESNKQERCIQYMKLIIEALEQIAEKKKYKIVELKLNSKEIKKYKDIAFKQTDTDLETLNEKQINEFYSFAKESIFSYKINPYYKSTVFLDILNKIII